MSEEALRTITLIAGADLSSHQYRFMYVSGSKTITFQPVAGAACIGVLQGDPATGEAAVIGFAGKTIIIAGAAVAVNAPIASDTAGRGVTASGDDYVMGTALTVATAAGQQIEMLIQYYGQGSEPVRLTDGGAGVTGKTFVMVSGVSTARTAVLYETAAGVASTTTGAGGAIPVQTSGTCLVTSGEAITAGQFVAPMAAGRAKVADHVRDVACGIALTTAGGAAVDITVLLFPATERKDRGVAVRVPSDIQTAVFGCAVNGAWETEDLVALLNAATVTDIPAGQAIHAYGMLEIITNNAVAHTVLWGDGGQPGGLDKAQQYITPPIAASYNVNTDIITDAAGLMQIQADVVANVTFRYHLRGYHFVQNDAVL